MLTPQKLITSRPYRILMYSLFAIAAVIFTATREWVTLNWVALTALWFTEASRPGRWRSVAPEVTVHAPSNFDLDRVLSDLREGHERGDSDEH